MMDEHTPDSAEDEPVVHDGPALPGFEAPEPAGDAGYQVLARKYRPQNFDDLIGQEPMVKTLTNAFASGRIAHAYMLTGVRGVGKTTTARLIARALNYETDTAWTRRPYRWTRPAGIARRSPNPPMST
jgi:DNA polymerase-3 subunit gamma/tau